MGKLWKIFNGYKLQFYHFRHVKKNFIHVSHKDCVKFVSIALTVSEYVTTYYNPMWIWSKQGWLPSLIAWNVSDIYTLQIYYKVKPIDFFKQGIAHTCEEMNQDDITPACFKFILIGKLNVKPWSATIWRTTPRNLLHITSECFIDQAPLYHGAN